MKFTREQLEKKCNDLLNFIAMRFLSSILLLPTYSIKDALELQKVALEHNPIKYVGTLIDQLDEDGEIYSSISSEHDLVALITVSKLLQLTPRQLTIAAILTLQEESGGTGE